jgi:lipoprotein-releasing system permease protein
MFARFEWLIAMRYLRPRRAQGFISIIALFSLLGIALGVATLIIVMSVMNGFRQELLQRVLGLNGHVFVQSYGQSLTDYGGLVQRLQGLPAVTAVHPMIEGQVMAAAAGNARGAVVRGLSSEDLRSRGLIASHIVSGSLDGFAGDDAIIIGARMAERMNAGVGSRLTLISPTGNITAFGSVPRVRSFEVVATFDVGMFEYDANFIFMPLPAAQALFRLPQAVSTLEIFTDDPDRAGAVTQAVRDELGQDYVVYDWQRLNSSFFNAIQVERNVMFLILTLIIVVAAFNIISSLIMLVKEKGSAIAILRTMGATRGSIMRIFFIAGSTVGVVGTVSGFILGLVFVLNIESIRQLIQAMTGSQLFAPEIYFLSRLPAKIDPTEVATVTIMALALSLLATVYPSWRAARIEPAEALRYE